MTPLQVLCTSGEGWAEMGGYGGNTGGGFTQTFCILFLCGMMAVAGTGCKNANTPADTTVQTRHLTIKVNDSAAASVKKATITDLGSTLSAAWTAGDEATYCNLSRQNAGVAYTGTLVAASTGVKSDLNGDVDCTADDYLAVVYPKNTTFVYNDPGTTYTYTFPLSGQDGTLATLATTFHQVYGRAHVVSVDGKTATATMDKMQSLLTVCKFSFKDKTTDAAIPVGTLTIAYGGADSKTDKYPQSASVTVTNLTDNGEATATAANVTMALTVTCPSEQSEVYVALLPETGSCEYQFTVTNSSGTYTGTADAWLKQGEYVPATGLRLVKQ